MKFEIWKGSGNPFGFSEWNPQGGLCSSEEKREFRGAGTAGTYLFFRCLLTRNPDFELSVALAMRFYRTNHGFFCCFRCEDPNNIHRCRRHFQFFCGKAEQGVTIHCRMNGTDAACQTIVSHTGYFFCLSFGQFHVSSDDANGGIFAAEGKVFRHL